MPHETLFDSRYRYDHIYPRGRSGEALRAYDTYQDDRMVVIKRPAPQDAPPIRAGQEVNIRTERRVLLQLKGHPVLTELLDEGTFPVGGQSHLYIVMERATGVVLDDEVRALAKNDERLPELEMLVILDALLDLLGAAHHHEIVYNDVDAKHLFWDRDSYRLKVIDWGNAVFLEGDEVTPQGVSRQSDIYQVGELIYFIVTGGQRLVLNGESLDFGEDAGRVPTRLQHIIQRAAQPVLDRRFQDVESLRLELADYRRPMERDRTSGLERIEHRLEKQCSQHELERLLDDVKVIQSRDPGYPRARALREQIEAELYRLGILSDLDAARIYLESANWPRAIALLTDVANRASGDERERAQLLLEAASMVQESQLSPPPAGILPAIDALFAGEPAHAAHLLQVTPENRAPARSLQWLFAERIQFHVPDVIVLRPHLLRLRMDLDELASRYSLQEAVEHVIEAWSLLREASTGRLAAVTDFYQQVVDRMADLASGLSNIEAEQPAADLDSIVASAGRAGKAAEAVVEQLKIVAAQVSARPEAAFAALDAAAALDPANPVFEEIRGVVDGLRRVLAQLGEHRALADGADLAGWFEAAVRDLAPFEQELPDPRIAMLVSSIQDAARSWNAYQQAAVFGNRMGAVEALQAAADAIRRLNPALAAWFTNVLGVVGKSRYVQRHALNAAFGRAMADGWSAWDRGSGIEAERLGKQALEEIDSKAEEAAADRLIRMGRLLRSWKEGNGEGNPELTGETDTRLLALLTEAEDRYWQDFTERMQSARAYLKAMGPGLIEHFEATSTAAQRILFFHYVLRGVAEMYEGKPDDAEFWRAAAEQALPEAKQHVACMALNNLIRDRQIVLKLAVQLDSVESLDDLERARRAVERSKLLLLLKPVVDMLHDVELALPAWERGDFRSAGEALEQALKHLDEGEKLAYVDLGHLRSWLERLYQVAAELSVARQRIADVVKDRQELPDPRVLEWHQKLISETELLLGARYARTFVVWQKTCTAMLDIYRDDTKRRSRKLRDFDELFNTAGIDLHPGYSLYRFWREVVEARPEFPAPPTDEPVPQYTEGGGFPVSGELRRRRFRLTRRRVLVLGLALVVLLGGAFGVSMLLSGGGEAEHIAVTWETFTPTLDDQEAAAVTAAAIQSATALAGASTATPTETPIPSDTPPPTIQPTDSPVPSLAPGESFLPTAAILLPTNTPVPTDTPTETPAATVTPTIESPTSTSVPAEAAQTAVTTSLRGRQNILLALEQSAVAYPWPETWFRSGELSGNWLLGESETGTGDSLLKVVLPADLLNQLFGSDAAVRVRRLEATLTLREYDPALVADGLVYFGLGLQGADESQIAIQAQMVRQDAINVGARVGDEFRARTTLPITNAQVSLALERSDDGNVTLFLDGESMGPPRFLTAPNAPAIPFLFVQQGGVIVSVTDLVVVLD